ncbi:YybH family protein [Bacteroidota bacterium]
MFSCKQYQLLLILFQLIFISNMSFSQKTNLEKDYNSLLAVERTFSKTAELLGTRSAFLRFLRDDAVVFNPLPVSGIELWTERPESESSLLWQPVYAKISLSGDFGFTTGPWEYRTNKNDKDPAAYGHYVTVWEKNELGLWEAAIDAGISYQSIDTADVNELIYNSPNSLPQTNEKIQKELFLKLLLQTDTEFSAKSAKDGFKDAFAETSSQNVRLYRNNYFPLIGKVKSLQFLNDDLLQWEASGGGISSADDLGYTYGIGEIINNSEKKNKNRFSYFRIWQKLNNDEWKLLLDLIIPIENE